MHVKLFPERASSLLTLPVLWLVAAANLLAAAEYQPGQGYFGRNKYIEYLAGDLPFVLSAPHGGREKPEEIPDRAKGTFAFDTNTQELARAIAKELFERTGHHAHVVICRVTRRKLDCNREIVEGAAGSKLAEQAWNEYQNFIDDAQKTVAAKYGKGFYIDLHGHGHKEPRLELGYLHKQETLSLPDAELNKPEIVEQSSLRLIARNSKLPYVQLLRGPASFGALMEKEGFPSTPSPAKPVPSLPYFNGGYNDKRHAHDAPNFTGLQIESNSKGVRDNDESRKKFAKALANTLYAYLDTHMGLKLPVKSQNSRP